MSQIFCDCNCDFLTHMKNLQRFLGSEGVLSPRKSCDFSLRQKNARDCNVICSVWEENSIPIAVWLVTGRFATEHAAIAIVIFGALRPRNPALETSQSIARHPAVLVVVSVSFDAASRRHWCNSIFTEHRWRHLRNRSRKEASKARKNIV